MATLGLALVSAARRSARALTGEQLLASTSLARWVTGDVLRDALDELVAAGRLERDTRRPSLFRWDVVYRFPRAAG